MHFSSRRFPSRFALLSLLLPVWFSIPQTNAVSFQRVTKTDTLWRFSVGAGSKSLNIGDDYCCLLSNRMNFMSSRSGRVYNDRTGCKTEERFQIKFIGEGLASIKRFASNEYVSCWNNGEARVSKDLGEWQKFRLEADSNNDRLTFFNPNRGRYLRASADGSVRCDSKSNQEASSQFLGWRTGSRSMWKAADEGRLVKTFVNSWKTKSRSYEYTQTIGVKQIKGTSAGSRARDTVRGGNGLRDIFLKFNSLTKTKWEDQKTLVWGDTVEQKATVEVPANASMRVYQIVGLYGPLEIYSTDFFEADIPAGPTEENGETVVTIT